MSASRTSGSSPGMKNWFLVVIRTMANVMRTRNWSSVTPVTQRPYSFPTPARVVLPQGDTANVHARQLLVLGRGCDTGRTPRAPAEQWRHHRRPLRLLGHP